MNSKNGKGGHLPNLVSIRRKAGTPVNQLRDPAIFEDIVGNLYLLFSGVGEQGIGVVSFIEK